MTKKILYTLTIINIVFQIVYSTFGKATTTELGGFVNIFAIFRAEYLLLSGLVSFFCICILFIMIIFSLIDRRFKWIDVIVVLLNIEYIMFYLKLISIQ